MRNSASILLPAVLLLASCGHEQTHRAAESVTASVQPHAPIPAAPTNTPPGTSSTTPADSLLVDVTRPTVVAYFATTLAQLDSEPDVNEALSDFQTYLPRARDSLEKLGVVLRDQYRDTIVYRDGAAIKRWRPPPDSAEVGYVLLVRGAPPRATYGVDTDVDLEDWVAGMLKEVLRTGTTPPTRPAPWRTGGQAYTPRHMLQSNNLLLAIGIAAGAYAWYRAGFRVPRILHLPARTARQAVVAVGWILVVGILLKSAGALVGDGRVQIRKSEPYYAYRARQPMLFWGEIAGELVMVGGIGAFFIILGRKAARAESNSVRRTLSG